MTKIKRRLVAIAAISLLISVPALYVSAEDRDEKRERHPQMIKALHALENAKQHLEKGAHDFGGHRAKALEHVEAAIHEVHEALEFDKK